jgi:hypothetical protein
MEETEWVRLDLDLFLHSYYDEPAPRAWHKRQFFVIHAINQQKARREVLCGAARTNDVCTDIVTGNVRIYSVFFIYRNGLQIMILDCTRTVRV